ncbi:MAG: sensor histidine kinase KdpD [Deltaproteobacteria bacterium]|nr:sensor histidine kinase KdpD [Deltaproteobacteria bacterium]
MAQDTRPDADALLAEIKAGEPPSQARLKVFLGMCPGVGKTYTMLQGAHQLLREGVDVVIGVVETHGRSEVAALLEGLPVIPRREVTYRGVVLQEMDLDAILERRPQVALVDELAHTNAPGSRHPKRYQDVLELLDAGISVYSTLNVQHIESRVDVVCQITGVSVKETVPDSVLDRADEIQLVDLTPEELRQRLEEGKVYTGDMAQVAIANFFKLENLAALREMVLRLAAERADHEMRDVMRERKIRGPWKTGERLLVAVGPDPHAESLIRWTRRIAGEMDCPWAAVHVEPDGPVGAAAKEQVTKNLSLARQLGGEVITTSGHDICTAILRVAQEQNATQIIVGKPTRSWWLRWPPGRSPAFDLIRQSGYIDVSVVQPAKEAQREPTEKRIAEAAAPANEFVFAGMLVAAVTLVSYLLEPYTGYLAIALLYLLLVVAAGLKLSRLPVLTLAATSALLWNFLFIPPRYTFYIARLHDAMMFAMFFVVAIAMGHLTSRLRASEITERRRERRTAALYELAHQAAFATDLDTGLRAAVSLVQSIFGAQAALLLRQKDHTVSGVTHPASSFTLSEKEKSVAAWAFSRRMPAGKFTDTLPDSEALHLPLQARTAVMGVLSIRPPSGKSFDLSERDLLEAFAVLIGLILEKEHIIEAFKHAEILEASERLRRALLDSVSHELKTPLSAVQAGLDALARQVGEEEKRQATLRETQSAVRRLHRVINNLLDMTRIEAGVIEPKLDWCDVGELIRAAIELAGDALHEHRVIIEADEALPMVKLDQALLEQCLCNLLLNAAGWSDRGTNITIRAGLKGDKLVLSVLDEGKGLSDSDLAHIFEKFYRASDARPGGTGLGLSIVEGFVRAHEGTVRAANRETGGAEFALAIPVEVMRADAVGDLA